MNRQEVFDKCLAHLREQGEKSRDDRRGCLYRGPNGLMCAVGCLIDDEHYDAAFEGQGAEGCLIVQEAIEKSLKCKIGHDDLVLLSEMQSIHDDWKPRDWESRFKRLAEEENLKYTT